MDILCRVALTMLFDVSDVPTERMPRQCRTAMSEAGRLSDEPGIYQWYRTDRQDIRRKQESQR